LLSSNMSSICPHNMANFGPLAAEIHPVVWGTNFNGFLRLGSVTAQHPLLWASVKLCGVEQRAAPMFGRATIRLGIGPHSSYVIYHHTHGYWVYIAPFDRANTSSYVSLLH